MTDNLLILITTAASIGFFHTLLGPDHYLPFIAMSRSGKWSLRKTTFVTLICGIGHVLSSVLLGLLGISFGLAIAKLELFESFRGDLATWALIAFGLVYFAWGVRRAIRNRPHNHIHKHEEGTKHVHTHTHTSKHLHVHEKHDKKTVTPWVLFIIFFLGPCEPLIPILMYPAAQNSMAAVWLVTGVFGTVTIITMLSVVLIGSFGINVLPSFKMEKYTHAIAGAIICSCGLSMLLLGL